MRRPLWLVWAMLPGCNAVLGIEELPKARTSCVSCGEERCSSQLEACRADAACAPVETCFESCADGDGVCHEKCKRGAAPSSDAVVALETCRAVGCASACQLGCGNVAWASPDESIDACRACLSVQCCEAAAACEAAEACQRNTWCRDGCVTLDCFQTCRIDNVAGAALADAAVTCAEDRCRDECGIGRNWSCVPASWPEDSSKTLEFAFGLYEFGTPQVPSPGFHVRACEHSDLSCGDPIAEGVTSPGGIAVFDFAAGDIGGFFKGFDHYVEVDVARSGDFPTLYQLSPPVTSPTGIRVTAMIGAPQFEDLVSAIGVRLDPARGHAIFQVVDCSGTNAPDVALSVEGGDDAVRPIYLDGSFTPVPGGKATATAGIGGLLNVKPGLVSVEGRRRDTGELVGRVPAVIVRPGWITSSDFCPSPL